MLVKRLSLKGDLVTNHAIPKKNTNNRNKNTRNSVKKGEGEREGREKRGGGRCRCRGFHQQGSKNETKKKNEAREHCKTTSRKKRQKSPARPT